MKENSNVLSVYPGLSFDNVRGQGYDGAGAMAGLRKGVSSRITKKYPLAPYVHCFSHRLNLCVLKVTKVTSVRDMFEHWQMHLRLFWKFAKAI